MPCISADGKPTESGLATLNAIKTGASTPQEIANITSQPLFRVRSGLRELVNAGFLEIIDEKHRLTPEGQKIIS